MNYQTKLEMKRLWRVMGSMSYNYFYVIQFRLTVAQPLLDDYMVYNAIDRPRGQRLWTWDDSSRIVNFFNCHLMKI